jgi:A/G-specific adenine glycosylase
MATPRKRADVKPSRPDAQRNTQAVRKLLDWYRAEARRLPWRAPPGTLQDPYAVWLSEIMLQQTTVTTVIPYFLKFMKRWPDFAALARADLGDVMSAWAGLGYYSRARNLHACARRIVEDHGGTMPADEERLLTLPGIGPYTAAAIAAIAFGRRAAPVDGNIERVLSRLVAIEEPLPASKPRIREIARALAPARHAGDFAQAMMDLGAGICTPRAPACEACPWNSLCAGRQRGIAAELPRREARKERPVRRGATFVLLSGQDEVYLERRDAKGLLAGMHGTPVTPFGPAFPVNTASLAPVHATFELLRAPVTHTFTHFDLELQVLVARPAPDDVRHLEGEWAPLSRLADFALPTLFRKVIKQARAAAPMKKGRRSP